MGSDKFRIGTSASLSEMSLLVWCHPVAAEVDFFVAVLAAYFTPELTRQDGQATERRERDGF